jgi:hypothetical protein
MKSKNGLLQDRGTIEQTETSHHALSNASHPGSLRVEKGSSLSSSLRWEEMDWFKKWERVARHEA